MEKNLKIQTPFGMFSADLSEAILIQGEALTKEEQHRKFVLKISEETKKYERMSYTTESDTLNLIFDNMTIRCSCLTNARLNDHIEKERVGVSQYAGSKFIVCFSHLDHESVPFWMCYGNKDRTKKVMLQFENFASKLNNTIYTDYALVADKKNAFLIVKNMDKQ